MADDLDLGKNAETVLERRYLARNSDGVLVETASELFRRVAGAVAAAEARHGGDPVSVGERFYQLMARRDFLPNSPALMNAGHELGQLAACFVVPVDDSMPGIFDAVKWAAMIQMSGGGTGFSFSRLRPAGDRVESTGGAASGPVSFIDVFNTATDTIVQGGRRRGANMGILRVDHPDIVEFIRAKLDPRRLTNFNLSVAVTDTFMRAVDSDADYALINPRTGHEVRRLRARVIWRLISNLAWQNGEPGVVFIDRINEHHPARHIGPIESTNPCGEQPLLPFESCVLGSINVANFVVPGEARLDEARLTEVVHDAVRFLDDVIEVNRYPLPQIEDITRSNRKIGLGVMGFADLLIRLGIPYDDARALAQADALMALVERESVKASRALARERGPFANYAGSTWDTPGAEPMRNATTTTVAPTGTISIIAGCSSGIEPLYAVSYKRTVLEGTELREVHADFRAVAEARGFASDDLFERLSMRGRVRGDDAVPADVQALFATAHDVEPEQHVRIQAAFQRHVHSSVSKTINLPREATPENVAEIYQLAYALGCKGVTVYRDGSRSAQVLSFGGDAVRAPEHAAAEAMPADLTCPECTQRLQGGRGCVVCIHCGWSRCG